MELLSPAKLNLGLWLLGKRQDNYHEIFTIFQAISLFDRIEILEKGPLRVETSKGIPQEENLVYKALRLMERALGTDLEIQVYIEKVIPIGGGLGGGSSNVATVLMGVNKLLGEPLSFEELKAIASAVSSDAVFFLYGGSAVGTGRGEKVQPIDLPKFKFVVVYPGVAVSTKKIYSLVGEKQLTPNLDRDKIIDCIVKGELEVLENRLGELCAEEVPQVGEVVRFLRSLGKRPLVSGSGSCVFFVGELEESLRRACQLRGWQVYEVESLGCSSTGRAPDFGSGGSWFESRHPSFPIKT
jgi:4-diphosphocytidyl-2-C-methyl-D-erythritol kinase